MAPLRSIVNRSLLLIGVCGLIFSGIWYANRTLEANFWAPHPSEASFAEHILELGGTYHIDKSNERHITGVWLSGTHASDSDVKLIMRLPFLTAAHFDYCPVTDESLDTIFSHPRLKRIRLKGSDVSPQLLKDRFYRSLGRLSLDE